MELESVPEPVMQSTPDIKAFDSFDDMNINENILRGIYSVGFERPSAIQQKAIVPIKDGRDILAQAQSGTGKTGAFSIGSLCRIDPTLKKTQVLVLAPTRELSQQIESVVSSVSAYMSISVYSATGGTPMKDDIRAMEKGAQFVVGTPGRVYDLMNRKVLAREHIRVLILDEADQMLEDRFKEQVTCILQMGFPPDTQVGLFSATMPDEVIEVANTILRNPVRSLMPPETVTLDGIKQYYVNVDREEFKYETLCDLYQHLNINQALIYVNKRPRAEWLAEKMNAQGFPVTCIHGEMDVEERRRRMNDFRKGVNRIMISTDLLARGIDVQQVSVVINFELPPQRENYVHRIGRSGRYGRKGCSINLLSPDETKAMEDIVSHFATRIEPLPEDLSKLT
jgi:translation initiation factor 4A